MTTYDVGDLVRLSVTITLTATGVEADPDTLSLYVEDPSGNVAVYTYDEHIAKDDIGDYHYDVSADQEGRWYYRWKGTGTAQGAEESTFRVREQQVPES